MSWFVSGVVWMLQVLTFPIGVLIMWYLSEWILKIFAKDKSQILIQTHLLQGPWILCSTGASLLLFFLIFDPTVSYGRAMICCFGLLLTSFFVFVCFRFWFPPKVEWKNNVFKAFGKAALVAISIIPFIVMVIVIRRFMFVPPSKFSALEKKAIPASHHRKIQ